MTRTTVGLLGASTIAPTAVLEPAARRADVGVTVVAAGDRRRAERFAARWGVPRVAGSYAALVSDPTVDVVYVSTAVVDHVRWVVAALEAGKDVLCEKPAATTAADARAMADAAERTGGLLAEAFHDQWHPLFGDVRSLVSSAAFGPVRRMTGTVLGRRAAIPGSVLHEAALGGGALRHSGCYAVHWMRLLTGSEPTVAACTVTQWSLGSDLESVLDLVFPGGVIGRVQSSFARDATPDDPPHLVVESATSRLEVHGLVVPQHGHRVRLTTTAGPSTPTPTPTPTPASDGRRVREWTVAGRPSYDLQLDAFLAARGDPVAARALRDDLAAQAVVLEAAYAVSV